MFIYIYPRSQEVAIKWWLKILIKCKRRLSRDGILYIDKLIYCKLTAQCVPVKEFCKSIGIWWRSEVIELSFFKPSGILPMEAE